MFTFDNEAQRYVWLQAKAPPLSITTPSTLKDAPRWHVDELTGAYYTLDPRAAVQLREYADERAERELDRTFLSRSPWLGSLPHPREQKLLPFQPAAIRFALERNRSYLALEMGLGKTPIAAVIANALRGLCLYICPPYMVLNVADEFARWGQGLYVHTGLTKPPAFPAVWILPDSRVHAKEVRAEVAAWLRSRANVSLLPLEKVNGVWQYGLATLLIVDEAQRYRHMEARRTRALFQAYVRSFRKVVFLSGTPMPSRPMDLWPVLSECAPETIDFMTEEQYGLRYCGGRYVEGKGWDFKHASNVEELAARIKGRFMLRLWKKDVLPDLPPKLEEVVVIGDELPPAVIELEAQILRRYSPEDLVGVRLKVEAGMGEDEEVPISTYRRLLAMIKAKAALAYIRGVLEDTDGALIVYGFHKEAIEFLRQGLADYKPLVVTGQTPVAKRQGIVKTFQAENGPRVILGNYLALGVGFNLTRASRVLFTEFSWVPADNDQAIDRAHRKGQTADVLAQYLVFRNSLDRRVIEVGLKKRRYTQHV